MGQRWRTPLSTWIKYKNLTAKSLEWWLVRGNYANMCNMTWFYRWIRKTWSRFIQIPRSFLILAIFVAQSMKISRCHITSPEKKKSPHGEVSGVRPGTGDHWDEKGANVATPTVELASETWNIGEWLKRGAASGDFWVKICANWRIHHVYNDNFMVNHL